jgi:hypothetical protein
MYNECRHIFTGGNKCGSPALKGDNFCYYHTNTRKRRKPGSESYNAIAREDYPLNLPVLDDPEAIQLAISDVVIALAAGVLDQRRAHSLLYGLQIASQHFRALAATTRAKTLSAPTAPATRESAQASAPQSVREVFFDSTGEPLGPEKESPDPEDLPEDKDQMTLGRMLLMSAIQSGRLDPATVEQETQTWMAFKRSLREQGKLEPDQYDQDTETKSKTPEDIEPWNAPPHVLPRVQAGCRIPHDGTKPRNRRKKQKTPRNQLSYQDFTCKVGGIRMDEVRTATNKGKNLTADPDRSTGHQTGESTQKNRGLSSIFRICRVRHSDNRREEES